MFQSKFHFTTVLVDSHLVLWKIDLWCWKLDHDSDSEASEEEGIHYSDRDLEEEDVPDWLNFDDGDQNGTLILFRFIEVFKV